MVIHKLERRKYVILEEVVYYLSEADEDPIVRLYIPSHLRQEVFVQYHDDNGHMGTEKTFQAIRHKYFWPCLFRDVVDYVNKCVPCQTMNLRKIQPRMQEYDTPPFPFAKIALDISGPYPKTDSGNQYIVSFIDLYSGWPEIFAVPDKKGSTVANLLMEEIFPRFGAPLQLVTDNGPENVNQVMKKTLENLNTHHVTTSCYHPQSNGKVERLHRTIHDILAKKVGDDRRSWDLYLNQTLAAIRFNISETTKFSPFYLLYSRDVVLPLDNILAPRRKYYGDSHHEIAIQEQHRAFVLMRQHQSAARQKQIDRSNKKTKDHNFAVGDLVYYKNHHRRGKLDRRWKPHYVVIKKTGEVSYVIKDQLTGATTRVHAEQLRRANIEEWELPGVGRPLRKVTLAAPLQSEDPSDHNSSSEEDPVVKRCRRVRSDSENESDIPLMQRQIVGRNYVNPTVDNDHNGDPADEVPDTDSDTISYVGDDVSSDEEDTRSTESMEVCEIAGHDKVETDHSRESPNMANPDQWSCKSSGRTVTPDNRQEDGGAAETGGLVDVMALFFNLF